MSLKSETRGDSFTAGSGRAVEQIHRQARRSALNYGAWGLVGLIVFAFDRSTAALLVSAVLLQIALTEWGLAGRLQRRPHRSGGQWLLWHQLWVLLVTMAAFAVLFDWPIDGIRAALPFRLRELGAPPAQLLGLSDLAFFRLVWQAGLSIAAGLFAVRVVFVSWRYGRWIRRLPQ